MNKEEYEEEKIKNKEDKKDHIYSKKTWDDKQTQLGKMKVNERKVMNGNLAEMNKEEYAEEKKWKQGREVRSQIYS